MKEIKLAIASDHAGYELKEKLKNYLLEKNCIIKDFGPFTSDSVDYPDYAHPLTLAVQENEFDLGITLCGSGNGINMVANLRSKYARYYFKKYTGRFV